MMASDSIQFVTNGRKQAEEFSHLSEDLSKNKLPLATNRFTELFVKLIEFSNQLTSDPTITEKMKWKEKLNLSIHGFPHVGALAVYQDVLKPYDCFRRGAIATSDVLLKLHIDDCQEVIDYLLKATKQTSGDTKSNILRLITDLFENQKIKENNYKKLFLMAQAVKDESYAGARLYSSVSMFCFEKAVLAGEFDEVILIAKNAQGSKDFIEFVYSYCSELLEQGDPKSISMIARIAENTFEEINLDICNYGFSLVELLYSKGHFERAVFNFVIEAAAHKNVCVRFLACARSFDALSEKDVSNVNEIIQIAKNAVKDSDYTICSAGFKLFEALDALECAANEAKTAVEEFYRDGYTPHSALGLPWNEGEDPLDALIPDCLKNKYYEKM